MPDRRGPDAGADPDARREGIAPGATEEALAEGRRAIAPWWRVAEADGILPPKSPPGRTRQAKHLRDEGHDVTQRGRIVNPERVLVSF